MKQRHKPTRSNDMQNQWRKDNSPQLFTHPIPVANTNRVGRQKHRATNCKSSHRCFLKSGSPAFSKSSTTNTLPVQSDLKASCVDVFFFPCCQNTIRLPLLSKPITKSFPSMENTGIAEIQQILVLHIYTQSPDAIHCQHLLQPVHIASMRMFFVQRRTYRFV